MVYKLLTTEPLFKNLLSSYKGGFIDMYIPNSTDEVHAYIDINEFDLPQFIEHFGTTVTLLKNIDNHPTSKLSILNKRLGKFIRTLPR